MSRPKLWGVAVPVVCLLAGFLLGSTRAYSHGEDIRGRNVDLSSVIHKAEDRVAAAETRAVDLQQAIDAEAGSDVSPKVAQVVEESDRLAGSAGLTAVEGPAIRVTLTDAPRDSDGNYPEDANPDDLVVHQQDVQSVVNALWAGGAEAMTIMDQRIIGLSAVRCIGNTLLLRGRAYSPPFVITAIGGTDAMVDALNKEPGVALFAQYVQNFGLGFDLEILDSVTMPAYDGLVRMNSAQEEAK
ncbi:DUF881 domain-containing protein [Nakamurella silvestris]|nr:DUF881 domain-containing protein [Nakamurella silvestris]